MSRTRDKSVPGSAVFARVLRRKDGTGTPEYRNTTITWSDRDVMTDVVTPGFARRSASGEIINNPVVRLRSNFLDQGSSARDAGPVMEVAYSHYIQIVPSAQSIIDHSYVKSKISRAESAAVTAAYASVNETQVSSLVELGELRETISFLMNPLRGMVNLTKRANKWLDKAEAKQAMHTQRLARYYKNLVVWERRSPKRRGKRPQPPAPLKLPGFKVRERTVRDIPSFWLAYRYGLMPLIYSFQDIQKALSAPKDGPPRETSRKRADESLSHLFDSWPAARNQPVVDGRFNVDYKAAITGKVESRAGVLYVPDVSVQARWGLQLNRVPAALYELIPLSFVADWFWTGSQAYDAVTAHFRAQKVLAAWVTTKATIDVDTYDVWSPANGSSTCTPSTRKTGRLQIDYWTRRPASLSDVEVQLRVKLNTERVADGLSLIHNFIASRGKSVR